MSKRSHVYVIAGPNGSGKTTFASDFLPYYADRPAFINTETLARGLSGFSPDTVALKAGRLLLEQIAEYAAKGINFAFETTLSGTAYRARLRRLREAGYAIHLFFLWIPDVRLSLARVASRVKMGGHDVAEPVVRRRFHKGIANFLRYYQIAVDSWMLFDNSGRVPHLIAEGKLGATKVADQKLYHQVLSIVEGQ